MDRKALAVGLLPSAWRSAAEQKLSENGEEIRLRAGRKPSVLILGREYEFSEEKLGEEQLRMVLEKASGASLHAVSSSLSEGYLNYRGIRIGVCGAATVKDGKVMMFRRISSLAIRVPRECRCSYDSEIRTLLSRPFENTLILGPPGAGKTTLLRELIRRTSNLGYRVAVVDERNELAAMDEEGAAFDLGRCTDVLSGIPKALGTEMLLRGMNPQIIAMDEVTAERDQAALRKAAGCGVRIMASCHGSEQINNSAGMKNLFDGMLFSWIFHVKLQDKLRSCRLERLVS